MNIQLPKTPSKTYQKEIAKRVAYLQLNQKVSNETLDKIYKEIDSADVIVTDPEIIRQDHEAGLIGTILASKVRMYPDGQVELAKQDHADRAARIALAQSKASQRGVSDMDTDSSNPKNLNTDLDTSTKDKTRGKGITNE